MALTLGHDQRLTFLVAGVQKSGTTALHSYLAEHPQLQAPKCKELHVFDADPWDDDAPPYDRLEDGFQAADGRLRFESTPITLYWPGALERVRRYRPDMRLILLFRDPVERAFSHWRMEIARGHEDRPFAWCVTQGRERVGEAHRIHSYVERGFYGRQLDHAVRLFGREQVLCLTSVALRRRPGETLARIAAFLGVEPFAKAETRTVRPERSPPPGRGETPDPASLIGLRELYREDLERFEAISGISAGDLADGAV